MSARSATAAWRRARPTAIVAILVAALGTGALGAKVFGIRNASSSPTATPSLVSLGARADMATLVPRGGCEICLVGTFGYHYANGYIDFYADRVENNRSGGHSGTLFLSIWLTATPYSGGTIVGYEYEYQLGELFAGQYFYDITSGSIPFNPPDGHYYVTMTVSEYGNGIVDWGNFDNRITIGNPPPAEPCGGYCPPDFPYCGVDDRCWKLPCDTLCGVDNCCGSTHPVCGSDGLCYEPVCPASAPTSCGDYCCPSGDLCRAGACWANITPKCVKRSGHLKRRTRKRRRRCEHAPTAVSVPLVAP